MIPEELDKTEEQCNHLQAYIESTIVRYSLCQDELVLLALFNGTIQFVRWTTIVARIIIDTDVGNCHSEQTSSSQAAMQLYPIGVLVGHKFHGYIHLISWIELARTFDTRVDSEWSDLFPAYNNWARNKNNTVLKQALKIWVMAL